MDIQKLGNKKVRLCDEIKINGIYEHYKGKQYKVLIVVWASEQDELEQWVVYQAQYDTVELGEKPVFARSLAKFMDKIIIDGEEINRFQLIS